jgi:glycosyltransferase involved in cell wall biosynthesis
MKRLAILSTHPIQYNAPLFRLLAAEDDIVLKVFYSKQVEEVRFDPDFGQEVIWDIPLTDGYNHESFVASNGAGCHQMLTAIEGFNPDALLVYGWNFPGHLNAMRHFHGKVPVWFRGDSTLLDPLPLWKKWLRKVWLRWVYRHVDKTFFVGSANKKYFLWAGLTEKQLVHAPHAVDNDFFSRDDENRRRQAREIRSQLGISEEAFVFLFVGKLEDKKQPLQLARAFRNLLLLQPDVTAHLVFVGAGELLERLAKENESCPKVHLVGFVNQSLMPVYYRLGDCLCLPSRGPGETWGLAVNEAIVSNNCAVLTTNRVACALELTDDDFTSVVPFDAHHEWSAALLKLIARGLAPMERKQTFEQHFNLMKICDSILGTLQEL